jgi:hypothetical protein
MVLVEKPHNTIVSFYSIKSLITQTINNSSNPLLLAYYVNN